MDLVGLAAPQLADSQLAHKPSESGRSSQASEDWEQQPGALAAAPKLWASQASPSLPTSCHQLSLYLRRRSCKGLAYA
ncbi:hypothetical protein HaLaN_01085, partial [Haematococcus lacustris]